MSDVLERAALAHLAVEQVELKRRQLLDERRKIIATAHEAGYTYRQIAATIGLSAARVQRAVTGNQPRRKPQHVWNPVDL